MADLPRFVCRGRLHLWGVEVKVRILDNGERVIEQDSLEKLLTAMATPMPSSREQMLREVEDFWRAMLSLGREADRG